MCTDATASAAIPHLSRRCPAAAMAIAHDNAADFGLRRRTFDLGSYMLWRGSIILAHDAEIRYGNAM